MSKRVLLMVLDSCGCGGDPGEADYGDLGANTLSNTARAAEGISLPALEKFVQNHAFPALRQRSASVAECGTRH